MNAGTHNGRATKNERRPTSDMALPVSVNVPVLVTRRPGIHPGRTTRRDNTSTMRNPWYPACMRPVEASYENGQLVPVHPLPLRPGERVGIVVVRRPDRARWDLSRLSGCGPEHEALASAGLDEWARALDAEDRH